MIPIQEYAGRDVAVFGLGRTGISAARALKAGGARVHAWDDNPDSRARAEAAGLVPSDINKMDWQQFAALVLSPGVPLKYPQPHRVVKMAEMTGVPIVGDMELFARAVLALPERARPKIIGVTGTNGKSTTTALIGHILKRAGKDVRVGGNIGTGVLDLEALSALSIYVLELSSYQLDLVKSLKCNVAVFLNISPDHLDRHGSMENYIEAKKRIFRNQGPEDTAVIGVDTLQMQSVALGLNTADEGPKVAPVSAEFALGRGVSAVDGRLFDSLDGRAIRAGDLRENLSLRGRHNHQNAAAAYAACHSMGLEPVQIMDGIDSFPGLAHRLEHVATLDGIHFINDSKATNSDSAEQALKAFPKVRWIVGGQAKSGGIASLIPLMDRVAKAYLIGEAAAEFETVLRGHVDIARSGTLQDAVQEAWLDARQAGGSEEEVILLSPACASFDQFKDFEARGEAFREIVGALDGAHELQRA